MGCWCKPDKCHGDVLLELSNIYEIYAFFNGKCNICENKCTEMSGWKCGFCEKVFCDKHNDQKYTCNCEKEYIDKK